MLRVLYEDPDLIVVQKPPGVDSQERRGPGADMVSEIKNHILRTARTQELSTDKSTKASKGPVDISGLYVGVIHRLDKPVGGILVYAKSKSAAGALSKQSQNNQMLKKYLAVLCGKVDRNVDNFVDYLQKDVENNISRIVDNKSDRAKGGNGGGNSGSIKRAELSLRVLEHAVTESYGDLTLAEITLKTGRHHQIRVQMSGHGLPIWGDCKYNPVFSQAKARPPVRTGIALFAYRLEFTHPISKKRMAFEQMPEDPIFGIFEAVRQGRTACVDEQWRKKHDGCST